MGECFVTALRKLVRSFRLNFSITGSVGPFGLRAASFVLAPGPSVFEAVGVIHPCAPAVGAFTCFLARDRRRGSFSSFRNGERLFSVLQLPQSAPAVFGQECWYRGNGSASCGDPQLGD